MIQNLPPPFMISKTTNKAYRASPSRKEILFLNQLMQSIPLRAVTVGSERNPNFQSQFHKPVRLNGGIIAASMRLGFVNDESHDDCVALATGYAASDDRVVAAGLSARSVYLRSRAANPSRLDVRPSRRSSRCPHEGSLRRNNKKTASVSRQVASADVTVKTSQFVRTF
jgi:hypothetical protein